MDLRPRHRAHALSNGAIENTLGRFIRGKPDAQTGDSLRVDIFRDCRLVRCCRGLCRGFRGGFRRGFRRGSESRTWFGKCDILFITGGLAKVINTFCTGICGVLHLKTILQLRIQSPVIRSHVDHLSIGFTRIFKLVDAFSNLCTNKKAAPAVINSING